MARDATEIQADLTAAYAARRIAMEAQSFTMDSGQGRQTVARADLTAINKTIRELQAELRDAGSEANGFTGVDHVDFQRNC